MVNQSGKYKEDMQFPRYIFAIGGAGKNLIFTTLEKEWVLREIIRPKYASTTVEITIIDTAIDEENKDREKIERIENNIKRLEEEYRGSGENANKNTGRISIIYRLLTKEMVLQSPYDLIGIGDNVKKATGASVWWINDPEILGKDWYKKIINRENFKELNFTKGVYRKRAIGKAIYYKAVSEGMFDIDLLQTAQVDIVIGLGGGTGSGMAFDLAKRLKSIQPTADITLFGVMSTLDESPDEKANNFAMISELEYGYLTRDTPFKNVIFIPMEVTRYPGKEKASDEHERLLEEFDETAPYIFVAYHNNPAQGFFSNLPDHAPFIIVTSQLVRYNVESIKKLKDKLIDALNNKEISLKNEEDIYENIKKFINEFYTEDTLSVGGTVLPDEDKSFIKEERFSKFNMILKHDFFKELEYNSVIHIKKAVDAGIMGAGSDDIEKQVSNVKSEIDAISIGDKGYRDDVDSMLYKILKKDIENIDELRSILNYINRIQDNNIVRDTLKICVKVDEHSLGRKFNQIREGIDTLSVRKRNLEGIAKSIETDLKNYEEKIKKDVEKNDQEWLRDEMKNLEVLDSIDNVVPILDNNFSSLKTQLGEYVSRINSFNKTKDIDAENIRNIEIIVDRIYQDLEKIGIYYDDKSSITRSLTNLKELRKAQLASGKKVSIIDKGLKTKKYKEWIEAKNRLKLKTTELYNDKTFGIKGNAVLDVYEYNVEQHINLRKEEIISKIIERAQERFLNTVPALFSGLKIALQSSSRRRDINIEDIVKSHLGYEVDITAKAEELKEKTNDINNISETIRMFGSLETILKNMTPILRRHSERLKSYHNNVINIEKDIQAMHRAKKDIIRYIMEIQPNNIFRATVSGANINNILEDQSEGLILKQNLQDGTERTIDNRYNTLARRVIETKDNTKRWEKTKLMNSLVTIANINPEFIDARKTISNAFSILKDNYSEWKCSWGETWGVGLVLFIAGIPFDNIHNVTDSRAGYYRYYKYIEESGTIFFHHSHMLEDGKFIKRRKIFDIENEEDKKLFLQNDKDVVNILSQNYDNINIKDSIL